MKVVKVIDQYNYVINSGHYDGVKLNSKFIVYLIGDEIKDPDTEELLGVLELPKTRCYATHVQEHLTIIRSDDAPKKTISGMYSVAIALRGFTEDVSPYSFLSDAERRVKVGDKVKQVEE